MKKYNFTILIQPPLIQILSKPNNSSWLSKGEVPTAFIEPFSELARHRRHYENSQICPYNKKRDQRGNPFDLISFLNGILIPTIFGKTYKNFLVDFLRNSVVIIN